MDDAELFYNWLAANPPDPRDKEHNAELTPKRSQPHRRNRLDLHGQRVANAKDLVRRYILQARAAGIKQITIITGKGLHSNTADGILKNQIAAFLDSGHAGLIRGWRRGNPHEGGDGCIIIDL